jgi:hypothetical protein
MAAFTRTETGLAIWANGTSYNVGSDHPSYKEIVEALRENRDELLDGLINVSKAITEYADGNVSVTGGVVSYKGEPIHGVLVDRILQFMREDFPADNYFKFLNNVMENPSFNSRNQLYTFLEHCGLPITSDGCFLAYKRVRSDFKDFHTGTFDNSVGKEVTIDRSKCDDNVNNACSHGLHVGTIRFVQELFNKGEGVIVVCKVNPRDVVSVPNDASCQKCRTCRYEVVDMYKGALPEVMHTAYDDTKLGEGDFDEDEDSQYDDEEVCEDCGDPDCYDYGCHEDENQDEDRY